MSDINNAPEQGPINVECSSSVTAEPGDYLQAHQIRAWLPGIPDGASVEAITREYGSQRDPVTATVGLTAKWSEVRRG